MATVTKNKNKNSRTLTFSIDGESLTRIARDTWTSDLPKKAINILEKGCMGMSQEQALSILNGKMKLIGASNKGDGTLWMENDNAKEMHGIPLDTETMITRLENKYVDLNESKNMYNEAPDGTWDTDDLEEDENYRTKCIENIEPKLIEVVENLEVLYPIVGKSLSDLPLKNIRSYRKIKQDALNEQLLLEEKQKEEERLQQRDEKHFHDGVFGDNKFYYIKHCTPELCKEETLYSGFLTPDGTFFGGNGYPFVHQDILFTLSEYDYFKDKDFVSSEEDVENRGSWIKLSSGHGWLLAGVKKITKEQAQFIIDYTMVVEEKDYLQLSINRIPLNKFVTILDGAEFDYWEFTRDNG